MRLEGKVAIVTGGGSGIGRAAAELFAREGAKVVVAEYKADAGQETAQTIKDAGGEALFVEIDVSDSAQVEQMVQATLDAYGGIDILFNNAGVLIFGTILGTDEDAWN
ncbi:MAG: SDR family NAD(P)-dependent oxidoreductase, partial [Anaerolineae bacterium]